MALGDMARPAAGLYRRRGGLPAAAGWYGAVVALAALGAQAGLSPGGARAVVEVGLAGLCAAVAADWAGARDPLTTTFWRWCAAAAGFAAATYLALAIFDAVGVRAHGPVPVLPLASLPLAAVTCLLVAMAVRVVRAGGTSRGLATLVDAAILGVALLALATPLVLVPGSHAGPRVLAVAVSWIAEVVVLVGIRWARANERDRRDPRGLGQLLVLVGGLAFLSVIQAAVDGRSAVPAPPFWFTALYGLAYAIGFRAPARDRLRPPRPALGPRASRGRPVRASAVPAALLFTSALALVAVGANGPQARLVVAGAIVVGAGFGLRQSLVVRDQRDRLARRSAEALLDGLTGLRNRRAFDADLAVLLAASAAGHPFAMALADVDELKRINDGPGGHLAGDQALAAVARALTEAVRHGDGVYRVGGDEFAILLPDADRAAAARVGARAAAQLASVSPPVHISVGTAQAPGDGSGARELVDTADRDLYDAKRASRPAGARAVAVVRPRPGPLPGPVLLWRHGHFRGPGPPHPHRLRL